MDRRFVREQKASGSLRRAGTSHVDGGLLSPPGPPTRPGWRTSPLALLVLTVVALVASALVGPTPASAATALAATTTQVTSSSSPSAYGQVVTLSAVVAAGTARPSGTVTFSEGATVLGTATIWFNTYSINVGSLSVGAHTITATFSGNASYAASSGSMTQTVSAASTTTALWSLSSSSVFGQSVALTAVVTAGSVTPAGTVTFSEGATVLGTAGLWFGSYRLNVASLALGSHTITATFSGNASFAASSSSIVQVVSRSSTAVSLSASSTPVVTGQRFSLVASVSAVSPGAGTPPGSVTFTEGATVLGTANLYWNRFTLSVGSLPVGAHVITATYNGSTSYLPSSTTSTLLVVLPTPTIAASSSSPSSVFGQEVVIGAEVKTPSGSKEATGTVTLTEGTTVLGSGALVHAAGSVELPALAPGEHAITVTYSGDDNYQATQTSVAQAVGRAGSTVTASPSVARSAYGQTVSVSAKVAAQAPGQGVPSGQVSFRDGAAVLGTATLDGAGAATLSLPVLGVGDHTITVDYLGDGSFAAGAASVALTVVPAAVTVAGSSNADPSVYGDTIAVTATVVARAPGAGTPTGQVTFREGESVLGTAPLDGAGSATATLAGLAVGDHTIAVDYSGDTSFEAGATTLSQRVVGSAATVSVTSPVDRPVYGQVVPAVVDVAAVPPGGGTPTGEVTLVEETTVLGAVPLDGDGSATFDLAGLGVGAHPITVRYSGDDSFGAASTTLMLNVIPAAVTVVATPAVDPTVYGQHLSLAASVAPDAPGDGTPSGQVSFTEGDTLLGTAMLDGGLASLDLPDLPVGQHLITVTYAGDGSFEGGFSTTVLTVTPAASSVAITTRSNPSVVGELITVTATVAAVAPSEGVPSGRVTFGVDGLDAGTATLDTTGAATLDLPALAEGDHTISLAYDGDSSFEAASGTMQQEVVRAEASVSVSASAEPAAYGEPISLVATVAPRSGGVTSPSGEVTFAEGTTVLGTAPVDAGGKASLVAPLLAVGLHTITATYSGDAWYAGATADLTHTVVALPVTVSATSATNPSLVGQPAVVTVSVAAGAPAAPGAAVPTGQVTFAADSAVIGAADLDGQGTASLVLPALGVGAHVITVTYAGSDAFAPGSSTYTQTVLRQPVKIAVGSQANPSVYGQAVAITATVEAEPTATGAPTGQVTFTESGVVLGTATLIGGSASLTLPAAFAVGDHMISVTYGGDASFVSASATFAQGVRVGTVASAAGQITGVTGQTISVAVTVQPVAPGSGTPAGTVTFTEGAVVRGTVGLWFGKYTLSTSSLPVGVHQITATYSGSATFGSSSTRIVVTVLPAATSVTLTPSTTAAAFGQSVTFTAKVAVTAPGAGTPDGTVTFSDGATVIGTASMWFGKWSIATSSLGVGAHTITATYSGSASYQSSSTSTTMTVQPASTTLSATASPTVAVTGQSVRLAATVTVLAPGAGVPSAVITFSEGTSVLGSGVPRSGTYALTIAPLALGTHQITASFAGSAQYNPSSTTFLVTVNPATTTTTLTATPTQSLANDTVMLRAVVGVSAPGAGTPAGSVTFTEGTTTIGSATSWFGAYAITTSRLAVGRHDIVAQFSGSTGFAGSSSAVVTVTVDPVLWVDPPPEGDPNYHPQTIPPYVGVGPSLGLVGDSITYYAGETFQATAQARGYSVAYTGQPGYMLATSKPWIDLYAATTPNVIVINLGTNDVTADAFVNPNFTLDLYKQRMAIVAAEFPRSCVVVTTMTTHRTQENLTAAHTGYTADRWNGLAASYNDYLRTSFSHVADWDAIVALHPEYLPDEVHTVGSTDGTLALAQVQLAAADTCAR